MKYVEMNGDKVKITVNMFPSQLVFGMTRKEARELAEEILDVTAIKDFSSMKKGDEVWYVGDDYIERGIVFSVERKENKIASFCVDFPDSGDFDEFDGDCLGKCFFMDQNLARLALEAKEASHE